MARVDEEPEPQEPTRVEGTCRSTLGVLGTEEVDYIRDSETQLA